MRSLFTFLFIFCFASIYAQSYQSQQATITFFSEAAIEDIAATNFNATSVFNTETGEIEFLVQMNGFQFERSLMQQHYNERFMETAQYPAASFVGAVKGFESAMQGKPRVSAKGKLTIHGQTREVEINGSITIVNEIITISSSFTIRLEDYKIKIPKLLWQNVTESVEVKIEFTYVPLE